MKDELAKSLRALSKCKYVNGPLVQGSAVCEKAAASLQAQQKQIEELEAALREACKYGGHDLTELPKYWRDAQDYPNLAAWLKKQEVQE